MSSQVSSQLQHAVIENSFDDFYSQIVFRKSICECKFARPFFYSASSASRESSRHEFRVAFKRMVNMTRRGGQFPKLESVRCEREETVCFTTAGLARSARSKSTNKIYEREAERYCHWARQAGENAEEVTHETPELICRFIVHRTKNMSLKAGSAEQVRKAVRSYYEGLGHCGEWRALNLPEGPRNIKVVEGNPAASATVSRFIKDYKKTKERLQEGEISADPLCFEHWCAIFNEFIGMPCADVEKDFERLRHIRVWTITLVSASLLLRFDEVSRIQMENVEFMENDLSKVRIVLPDGSKNRSGRVAYLLEEWPTCADPRVSPLCALARWLRIRGLQKGPLFCEIGSDQKMRLDVSCNSASVIADLREALKAVGVVDVERITTHSAKRGGAQFYDKQGMSYDWIMSKGHWTDLRFFPRYLSLNYRQPRMEFQSPMAQDVYHLLSRLRHQDELLERTKMVFNSFAIHQMDGAKM